MCWSHLSKKSLMENFIFCIMMFFIFSNKRVIINLYKSSFLQSHTVCYKQYDLYVQFQIETQIDTRIYLTGFSDYGCNVNLYEVICISNLETNSEPSQISKMECFCKNRQQLSAVNCFCKRLSQMSDRVLNTSVYLLRVLFEYSNGILRFSKNDAKVVAFSFGNIVLDIDCLKYIRLIKRISKVVPANFVRFFTS